MSHQSHHRNPSLIIFTLCAIGVFAAFGFYHLAQCETADEHLWKYGRIPQYWNALATRQWKKTYINDKPGITVALFSGIGLLRHPDPNATQLRDTSDKLLQQYDVQQNLSVNFAMRAPIIVLGIIALLGTFLLLRVAIGTRAATFSIITVGTHPIIIGMSQIINPDAFFWIFGMGGIAAYLALEKTHLLRYAVITGLCTGFALLSKYTAFTLFLLYAVITAAFMLFGTQTATRDVAKILTGRLLHFLAIGAIAIGTFMLFLPATISDPGIILRGIGQFLPDGALPVVIIAIAGGIGAMWYMLNRYAERIVAALRVRSRAIAIVISVIFLGTLGCVMFNTWTGQRIVPFDKLRQAVYANEPSSFNFKPYISKSAKVEKRVKAYFTNAYPLTFSLTPVMICAILYGAWITLRRADGGASNERGRAIFLVAATFTIMYLLLTVKAKVIINVRYTIVLYPLFAIMTGMMIDALLARYDKTRAHLTAILAAGVLIAGAGTLWFIRPFSFSYANVLLPRAFSIHDSWGHGSYEAAQYLNALPHAENLVVWSANDGVCRFFVGQCLISRKIDLAAVAPDYFVVSNRGVLKKRNRFILNNNPDPAKDADYYYDNLHAKAAWELHINGRPTNFVTVIPYEKPHQ